MSMNPSDGISPKLRRRASLAGRNLLLAALVGVVAGIGAIAFHWMCHWVSHHSLAMWAGYEPSGPAGEKPLFVDVGRALVPWMLLIVPTIGGLISGVLVYVLAPEAEGHGTDAAIHAYHHKGGQIRSRVPIIKMISAAITLGSGGSGGREGPIAQIGAGFGSFVATKLKLSDFDRRVLMAAGLGAGIGAIFRAPLAGAIFATEVLYRDPDFESEALIPAFISTTVAYCVFSSVFGFDPLFSVQAVGFDNPTILLPLAVMAVLMSAASWLYVRTFYGMVGLFGRLKFPKHFRPMLGAFLTGCVGVGLYYAASAWGEKAQLDSLSVLSFGYGFLQDAMAPGGQAVLLIPVLLMVGFGKILTTSLTVGSGGSGGVFGPSMVIGGALGGAVGLVFHRAMPGVVSDVQVVAFVILGMAAFFTAAAKTPVSTLIIVSEMTASYALLLPSMWVCALAYVTSRPWTIFTSQVRARIDSPAHRGELVVDVLDGLHVRDVVFRDPRRTVTTVPMDMLLRDVVQVLTQTLQSCFPVVDAQGKYYGLFGLDDIRQYINDSELGAWAIAQDLARTDTPALRADEPLVRAVQRFADGSDEELPVLGGADGDEVVGLLRRKDVIATYNARVRSLQDGAAS